MSRKPRELMLSNYSHIIVQGIEKKFIFKEKYLKELYLCLLKKNLDNSEVEILAYCIMGNHAHLLLHSTKINAIVKYMHKVNTNYAIKYNKCKNRVGYVFRDRYYLQPILSRRQLYNCLVYIHRNPVNAHIVSKYEDYEFSSYNEYLVSPKIITKESIKLIFGQHTVFLEVFNKIHNSKIDDDIRDIIELEEKSIVIKEFMASCNKSLEEIKKDRKLLKKLLIQLKIRSGLSLRKMGSTFNLGKDTIKKIIEGR